MPGFDPDQPRDEGGRWTSGDASNAIRDAASDYRYKQKLLKGLAFAGEKEPIGEPVWLEKVLPEINEDENLIRNEPLEHAVIYNANGRVTLPEGNYIKTSGQPNYVQFTDEEAALMKGAIMTHNHPSGRSFSLADMVMAERSGLNSIRVAGSRDYDYEFYPPHKYNFEKEEDVLDFQDKYVEVNQSVYLMMYQKLERGDISEDDANYQHGHLVNEMFAKAIGAKYVRKPNREKRKQRPDYSKLIFKN